MSNDGAITDGERELLVEQYNSLREEIRLSIQHHNNRILSGIAGIGALTGYALLRDSRWLFALIPFVIGVIFIQTVNTNRWLAANATHLVNIEARLSQEAPLYCWESKYGVFYGTEPKAFREFPHTRFSLDLILDYAMLIVAILVYATAILAGYVFWPSRPTQIGFLTQTGLLAVYFLFTIFLAVIGSLAWWYKEKVKQETNLPNHSPKGNSE